MAELTAITTRAVSQNGYGDSLQQLRVFSRDEAAAFVGSSNSCAMARTVQLPTRSYEPSD